MTRAKVAVLISGSGTNMAALLYAAKQPECPYEIVLVASNNPDAEGLTLAHGEGIATFAQSHKGIERAVLRRHHARIRSRKPTRAQFVALAGYMRILSDAFVQQWEGRMLNIHPSLCSPNIPGLHTHQRALEAGDKVAGCSVHLVTPELDARPCTRPDAEVAILPQRHRRNARGAS
jgi:phosphoribosylglycinamide formyltransferase-1